MLIITKSSAPNHTGTTHYSPIYYFLYPDLFVHLPWHHRCYRVFINYRWIIEEKQTQTFANTETSLEFGGLSFMHFLLFAKVSGANTSRVVDGFIHDPSSETPSVFLSALLP